MSPLLFGVHMDGLLDELKDLGIGFYIGQNLCGAAGYADYITLLCPTSSGLRKLIVVCEKYAKLHHVLFKGSKANCWCASRRMLIRILKQMVRMFLHVRKQYIWEIYFAQLISMKWCLMVSSDLTVV